MDDTGMAAAFIRVSSHEQDILVNCSQLSSGCQALVAWGF